MLRYYPALIVQDDPAPSEVPQVLLAIEKSAAFAPTRLTDVIASAVDPALESVNVFAALTDPTGSLPKLAVAGLNVACAATAAVPSPLKVAVCIPTLSVTFKLAVPKPGDDGVNVTPSVHEAPGASEAPQVFETTAKRWG